MPEIAIETVKVFGVRWTNREGDTVVRRVADEDKACRLVIALRGIQDKRGWIPDAHLVTREYRGVRPVGEWVAALQIRGRRRC